MDNDKWFDESELRKARQALRETVSLLACHRVRDKQFEANDSQQAELRKQVESQVDSWLWNWNQTKETFSSCVKRHITEHCRDFYAEEKKAKRCQF